MDKNPRLEWVANHLRVHVARLQAMERAKEDQGESDQSGKEFKPVQS